jgi:hypothetical protein
LEHEKPTIIDLARDRGTGLGPTGNNCNSTRNAHQEGRWRRESQHVLVEIPKTLSVSDAMKQLKGGSSNAINKASLTSLPFAWQIGYGAFTVSKSSTPDVVRYIANQREHHQSVSYEDEFKMLLEKHDLEYDPRYLLD